MDCEENKSRSVADGGSTSRADDGSANWVGYMSSLPKRSVLQKSSFYQDLVASTGVPDLSFAGGSHGPKKLEKSKKDEEKKKN